MRTKIGVLTGLLFLSLFLIVPRPASANVPDYESSRINSIFSSVMNGGYASQAAGTLAEKVPLIGGISRLFSLEDEAAFWIERETGRYARNLVREEMGQLGLARTWSAGGGSSRPSGGHSSGVRPAKIRAHLSTHRMGLTFVLRF